MGPPSVFRYLKSNHFNAAKSHMRVLHGADALPYAVMGGNSRFPGSLKGENRSARTDAFALTFPIVLTIPENGHEA